uniref:protein prenyltransferase alpha subunit repeat-containing protein 1 n=1 Tax=Erigeron canadensis TaxID=72917 RepID=UPI001CB9BF01|nr:protein prenyltransferase alpha subunit repeat-containing protein 1 [Erigeron canadensis]
MSGTDQFSSSLLHQLESILESDPFIDEVGFVHPSQFAAISDSSMSLEVPLENEGENDASNMAFWSREHKLGISTHVMQPLYIAAKCAFMSSLEQYRTRISLHKMIVTFDSSSLVSIENDVLKHSKALLLLSCDFGTAWNGRKEVVVKKQDVILYLDELKFSSLVLSYSPKSERAWSHRRWVIKMIAGKYTDLHEVLSSESELAKRIAEKSKMNYRAWNHRCWLVSYMSKSQVVDELVKYRDWAGLHVADNSCFHYRTRLMTRTLEDSWHKEDSKATPAHIPEVSQLWKEELTWSEILLKRYIGREALWLYRRFLSLYWIKHFAGHMGETHVDLFVDSELQLFRSCTTIPDNVFEDFQSQAMFAATYMMWLITQMDEPQSVETRDKVGKELEEVLTKVFPEKAFLWDLVRAKSGGLIGV